VGEGRWEPDPAMQQLLSLQLTELREPRLSRLQGEEWRKLENSLSAKGTLRSGALVLGLLESAVTLVEQVADDFIATILPSVRNLNGGRLPPGAGDWLRSAFDRQVGTLARGLGDMIMTRRTVQSITVSQDAFRRKVDVGLARALEGRKRRLEIQLQTLELSERLRSDRARTPMERGVEQAYDVFVSYATEDGADVARPLATELERRGFRVWIDQAELRIGASLMDTIEDALSRSRFGVVVITPGFLKRRWPRRELNALATIADAEDRKVILPIWHGVDHASLVAARAVFLADLLAANARDGIGAIADQIERELREPA
jgi:hypothetical protein